MASHKTLSHVVLWSPQRKTESNIVLLNLVLIWSCLLKRNLNKTTLFCEMHIPADFTLKEEKGAHVFCKN